MTTKTTTTRRADRVLVGDRVLVSNPVRREGTMEMEVTGVTVRPSYNYPLVAADPVEVVLHGVSAYGYPCSERFYAPDVVDVVIPADSGATQCPCRDTTPPVENCPNCSPRVGA